MRGLLLAFLLAAPAAAGSWRRTVSASYAAPSATPPAQAKIKVAFFDADKTLRVAPSGGLSANGPRDVMLLPFVAEKLGELAREGFLIAIVSNQAGIPREVSQADADAALRHTVRLIRRAGGQVHYYDFAARRNDDRKPGTGMARRLEHRLVENFGARIDLERSIMVGDSAYAAGDRRPDGKPGDHHSNADRLFAERLGVAFREPADFFGWRAHGVDLFKTAAQVRAFLKKHSSRI